LCVPLEHPNAKIVKLLQLEEHAKHEILVISDADVRVPPQLARELVTVLQDLRIGLANCFYRLANPSGLAMHLEAIGVNADFWSQVLQSRSLKPLQFALGAVMATRRSNLAQIGGFAGLADCLADDYQLGRNIVQLGYRIEFAPVVVETDLGAESWAQTWRHQLRWSRTIRVSRPSGYYGYAITHATFWSMVAMGSHHWWAGGIAMGMRMTAGVLVGTVVLKDRKVGKDFWLIPLRDLFGFAVWLVGIFGRHVDWRDRRLRLRADGSICAESYHRPQ